MNMKNNTVLFFFFLVFYILFRILCFTKSFDFIIIFFIINELLILHTLLFISLMNC